SIALGREQTARVRLGLLTANDPPVTVNIIAVACRANRSRGIPAPKSRASACKSRSPCGVKAVRNAQVLRQHSLLATLRIRERRLGRKPNATNDWTRSILRHP